MKLFPFLLSTLLLSAPSASLALSPQHMEQRQALKGLEATVYKSPTCDCCDGYIAFLRQQGVTVEVISDDMALAQAKAENGVPYEAQSCHTVLLSGYVVEGHVPLAALEKLLTEQPDLTGIAMPGMPTGTPGMEGPQLGPLEVVGFGPQGLSLYASL